VESLTVDLLTSLFDGFVGLTASLGFETADLVRGRVPLITFRDLETDVEVLIAPRAGLGNVVVLLDTAVMVLGLVVVIGLELAG
jgi:hypothetical protein